MEIQSDFLVIGSGVAGLSFALKAADFGTVVLITKKELMDSNSTQAQGGIASVFSSLDSFDNHIHDTHESGAGLCKNEVVEMVVKQGPERIRELIAMGVNFNLSETQENDSGSPSLDLGREGGHSHKRIVHAQDMTGLAVASVLADQVQRNKNITVYNNHIAIDLITYSTRLNRGMVTTTLKGFCGGAYVLDRTTDKVHTFTSKITLLATGGAGKVYLYTSNPDIATGDGIAMGYRAGASVANLEFVQFHPTCLFHPDAKNFLISEAVRGEGAILIDSAGHAFMEKYEPVMKDLACRDKVARAIDTEMKKSGDDSVFLDISHQNSEFIKRRFPNLYKKCLSFGIDMTKDPIPVVPAAHYMCGGITTDIHGRTDIRRLYAIGETACTGLHGANRLASNSLIEALVYADTAFKQSVKDISTMDFETPIKAPPWDETGTTQSDEAIMVSHNWDEIRRFMWNYVGIVRSNKRLDRAKRRIENIQKEIEEYYWDIKISADLIELRNIAIVSELIIKCAMHRKESRGLHYTIEYPERDDKWWKKDTIIRRAFLG
ncbi:MAG: L-aspartate oxidase [Desulfobacterales bacterium]|nr:L-aspartate oxidase [Desulfobacterales bacterium]MDD4071694.1 L-aspartate oxidase [Desulfobacterales bacterium]MDD4391402.1 L-aspartate oxidase [Desulfobacterales bacterium]